MLAFENHADNPEAWAKSLGISREAVEIYLGSDVIDLHVDSFIWTRIIGYDLTKRHSRGLFGARFYSQVDLPRIREARVTGAIWSITTNPLRRASRRPRVFRRNLDRLQAIFAAPDAADDVVVVRTAADYRAARRSGKHAAFIGVQGGNALDLDGLAALPAGALIKVTLVHLYNSPLGTTSSPLAGPGARPNGDANAKKGRLTPLGHAFVEQLNAARVFVDVAHINRRGFFDAVAAHDRTQPLLVSHTGVSGVYEHWRNLDDEQIRAVAATGGTIGVMYQSSFLGGPWLGGRAALIVDHMAHIIEVAGEDFVSLGSDWDGMISTPRDLPTCLELPRLVQLMLDRGWSAERIGKILGGNFLRALTALRG